MAMSAKQEAMLERVAARAQLQPSDRDKRLVDKWYANGSEGSYDAFCALLAQVRFEGFVSGALEATADSQAYNELLIVLEEEIEKEPIG